MWEFQAEQVPTKSHVALVTVRSTRDLEYDNEIYRDPGATAAFSGLIPTGAGTPIPVICCCVVLLSLPLGFCIKRQ